MAPKLNAIVLLSRRLCLLVGVVVAACCCCCCCCCFCFLVREFGGLLYLGGWLPKITYRGQQSSPDPPLPSASSLLLPLITLLERWIIDELTVNYVILLPPPARVDIDVVDDAALGNCGSARAFPLEAHHLWCTPIKLAIRMHLLLLYLLRDIIVGDDVMVGAPHD